jgi:hypothetical protein
MCFVGFSLSSVSAGPIAHVDAGFWYPTNYIFTKKTTSWDKSQSCVGGKSHDVDFKKVKKNDLIITIQGYEAFKGYKTYFVIYIPTYDCSNIRLYAEDKGEDVRIEYQHKLYGGNNDGYMIIN